MKSIKFLKSQLAISGSELTISFHNLDSGYETNWNPLEVVRVFGFTRLADRRSWDTQSSFKSYGGDLHACIKIVCMFPIAIASVFRKIKCWFLCLTTLHMISQIPRRIRINLSCVVSSLLLLFFPQKVPHNWAVLKVASDKIVANDAFGIQIKAFLTFWLKL